MNQLPIAGNEPNGYDDNEIVNPSANTHMNELLAGRLSRRQALRGGVSVTAATLLGGVSLAACGGGNDDPAPAAAPAPAPAPQELRLGFDAVAKNRNDLVTVPAGYQVGILHALGDPMHWGDASWADNGSESADSYNRRIGDGHDGMHYFGLSESGTFQADRSDRGLLCVNHEYVVGPYALHPNGRTVVGNVRTVAAEVEKEIHAHGVSICEVKRGATGTAMSMVRGSRYNRRVTSATEMDIAGPAKGSALMLTKFSPTGAKTRGTNNNCANGYTPWGTYLTCEENFLNVIARAADDDARRSAKEVIALKRYGLPQNRRSPYLWDTAGSDDLFARWSSSVTAAGAAQDYRNVFNTFGWVVEIDPFNPDSTPVKRTALGRFNHEGAWPAPAVAGQPIVLYMGDDARNEYIYKFVSKAPWDPADVGRGLAAGAKYLDEGTLYVAKFGADGRGQWIELTHGKNGLDAANTVYPFADQADVVTHARLAGDVLGATKMDRPEWGAVNPRNGEAYMTLTNNNAGNRVAPTAASLSGRQARPDAANPRFYDDGEGNTGNPNGHIIRWREDGGSGAATAFTWDIYLFGAEEDAPAEVNLSGLTAVNDFSSPDGLSFDPRGLLWIETDDGAYTDVTNCMLLAAVPGQVGDGGAATAAGGTATLKGANATADTVRRFLVGPVECEITGIAITPDARTLFINVQHPGEDGSLAAPTSHWPDSQGNAASTRRPRSATVVITRTDGGAVGV
ncbi:PhoX family protein [Azohydromonas caseinilytica]|uniref:PhoX family phosphatase n=1 Tax=Azohydromonas caseinilytica TaxID=2728836 RepID=A0A848FJ24_9BURK|nr:PhoX family phosphatase [Azohydromonas caseinilytica]NML18299.1 PhoX family phosphatase [Azohydromonas caseinilytica]